LYISTLNGFQTSFKSGKLCKWQCWNRFL